MVTDTCTLMKHGSSSTQLTSPVEPAWRNEMLHEINPIDMKQNETKTGGKFQNNLREAEKKTYVSPHWAD